MVFAYLTLLLSLASVILAVSVLSVDEEVATHCRFALEGQNFDLCPILRTGKDSDGWTVESERETPPTVTKTQYRISFNGPLPRNDSQPNHIQCPEGTWMCMTMLNSRSHHDNEPPRILRKVPVAGRLTIPKSDLSAAEAEGGKTALNVTVQLSPYQKDDVRHKILHVRYHGGHYVDSRQLADMQFVCDHSAEEPTSPTFLYEFRGQHAFRWRTKHACGTITANEPADDPPPPEAPLEEEEPPADEESDSNELIDLPPLSGRSSRSSWMLVISSTAIVILLLYLTYYPPLVIRRRLLSFFKSRPSLSRYRVGEHVLVRWAQEDMGYEDGEEDVMVNGDRISIFEDDEQIPLKPSPRKGPVTTYGIAL